MVAATKDRGDDMRSIFRGWIPAAIAAVTLAACGGGGGSEAPPNSAPVARAGSAQTVASGATVTLNGTASSDGDGSVAGFSWTQTAGATVTLNNATTAQPSFVAPTVGSATTFTFSLVVTDNDGAVSGASAVTITVNPPPNVLPTANAGAAQTVAAGATVTLDGSGSTDSDGSITSHAWTQVGGTAVSLSNAAAAQPTFVAPSPGAVTTLTFSLTVADNRGGVSAASTVTITVNPVGGIATVTGTVRFERVQYLNTSPFGLNYASVVPRPSRGVIVRALNATTQAELATGVTDAAGGYSLTVQGNISIVIQVVARMQRDASQPLPRWDVRVQEAATGVNPYTHNSTAFNSSSVGQQNVLIPTGINANGTAAGARASGPFAILDTVYTSMQLVLGVAPTSNFPELIVDWDATSPGTFFTAGAGGQRISLNGNLTEDTDEFDQHVVAHEYGHYVEFNFARSDSIGGSHGLGDRLDPRVAFGEGFGYAFAAIALNDPLARDTFVDGGQQVAGGFNVDINPATNPPGQFGDGVGCWCSETSVQAILWDLYDASPDGNDNIALGFAPLWSVLVGPQRNTESATTIFSFIALLKAAQPASAALIDALVTPQNINSAGIDSFASNETSSPYAATLPVYSNIIRGGGPVVVASTDDGGRHNKAGNRRFLRFTATSTGPVTVTMTTSNVAGDRDPDFLVRRAGALVAAGTNSSAEYPETETFNVTAGSTYIIDAYDCANGCSEPSGTPGDYNLTVTIN